MSVADPVGCRSRCFHYNDVIMSAVVPQITNVSIVCSTVGLGADQRKHQSSASLAFVRGIHWWPVNSPHKKARNAENVSIWWRHHGHCKTCWSLLYIALNWLNYSSGGGRIKHILHSDQWFWLIILIAIFVRTDFRISFLEQYQDNRSSG